MNPLADLLSAGAPAAHPAPAALSAAGRPAGDVSAPLENVFASLLSEARGMSLEAADYGVVVLDQAPGEAGAIPEDGRPGTTAQGDNLELADALPAAAVLPPGSKAMVAGDSLALPEAAARFVRLPGTPTRGNPLPSGVTFSGKPLPPQTSAMDAAPVLQPGGRHAAMTGAPSTAAAPTPMTDPAVATLATARSDGAQAAERSSPPEGLTGPTAGREALRVPAVEGAQTQRVALDGAVQDERNLAERLPAALERPGDPASLQRGRAGADGMVDVAVLTRPGAMPPADGSAAAAVFDPRAILEANARHSRGAAAQIAAAESPERTAHGVESSEPASRPMVARAVAPTLLTRDMSALAERIETLAHRPGGVASVNVSMGDLGNVEISVRMEARQAHVQFLVQDAAAREALESQLPRLRTMLEESGLKLGDVNTGLPGKSDREAGNQQHARQSGDPGKRVHASELPADDNPAHQPSAPGSHLLDAFA